MKKSTAEKSSQLSLVLPPAMYILVRAEATRRGLSMAAYIRLLIAMASSGDSVSSLFTTNTTNIAS